MLWFSFFLCLPPIRLSFPSHQVSQNHKAIITSNDRTLKSWAKTIHSRWILIFPLHAKVNSLRCPSPAYTIASLSKLFSRDPSCLRSPTQKDAMCWHEANWLSCVVCRCSSTGYYTIPAAVWDKQNLLLLGGSLTQRTAVGHGGIHTSS